MHEELVRRLRAEANGWCANCCYKQGDCICAAPDDRKKDCDIFTKLQAADAIEFLQTYKVAFENIVSMGGWWLVGQDKNLYRMDVPMNWPPKGTKTVELFPLPEPPKEAET